MVMTMVMVMLIRGAGRGKLGAGIHFFIDWEMGLDLLGHRFGNDKVNWDWDVKHVNVWNFYIFLIGIFDYFSAGNWD